MVARGPRGGTVDTGDLKSLADQACEFDSRRGHHLYYLISMNFNGLNVIRYFLSTLKSTHRSLVP